MVVVREGIVTREIGKISPVVLATLGFFALGMDAILRIYVPDAKKMRTWKMHNSKCCRWRTRFRRPITLFWSSL